MTIQIREWKQKTKLMNIDGMWRIQPAGRGWEWRRGKEKLYKEYFMDDTNDAGISETGDHRRHIEIHINTISTVHSYAERGIWCGLARGKKGNKIQLNVYGCLTGSKGQPVVTVNDGQ